MATLLPYAVGDVRANRDGLLSPAQQLRLLQQLDAMHADVKAYVIEFGVVNLGILALLLMAGLEAGGLTGAVIVAATLMLIFERLVGARARKLAADVDARRVTCLTGPIQRCTWLDRAGIKRYGVRIAGQQFQVQPHVYAAIQDGDPYRVYCTPRTHTLLSMEAA